MVLNECCGFRCHPSRVGWIPARPTFSTWASRISTLMREKTAAQCSSTLRSPRLTKSQLSSQKGITRLRRSMSLGSVTCYPIPERRPRGLETSIASTGPEVDALQGVWVKKTGKHALPTPKAPLPLCDISTANRPSRFLAPPAQPSLAPDFQGPNSKTRTHAIAIPRARLPPRDIAAANPPPCSQVPPRLPLRLISQCLYNRLPPTSRPHKSRQPQSANPPQDFQPSRTPHSRPQAPLRVKMIPTKHPNSVTSSPRGAAHHGHPSPNQH